MAYYAENGEARHMSDKNGYEWFNLKIVRNRFSLEFENPYDKRVNEEITLIHKGCDKIKDFPLPVPGFRNGIRIIDEDNSILSFLSHKEILDKIRNYDQEIKERFLEQLKSSTILWITFPEGKEIKPTDTRVLSLLYWPSELDSPKRARYSYFDIPIYTEAYPKYSSNEFDTFFFIKPPKNFVISIFQKETFALDEKDNKILPKYVKFDSPDLNSEDFTILAKDAFVNIRLPYKSQTYFIKICYEIGLPSIEKRIWKYSLPASWMVLFFLILLPASLFFNEFSKYLIIHQETVYTLSGVIVTLSGAIIALVNNPIISQTRYLLFFDITLVVVLLFVAPIYPPFPTNSEL